MISRLCDDHTGIGASLRRQLSLIIYKSIRQPDGPARCPANIREHSANNNSELLLVTEENKRETPGEGLITGKLLTN